jgi:recA bacterial DNA recombination protein
MRTALLKQEFASVLGDQLDWQSRPQPETVESGVPDIRLPRGCLTEIFGPASSGRTTLLYSVLAAATGRGELCALVDAGGAFDPASARAAGVHLGSVLWVNCGNYVEKPVEKNVENALRASDFLVQGGGFGIVAMDLGDAPPQTVRRISLTSWFRLRRAVEHTPTVLVALARQSHAKTCASLTLECRRERSAWSGNHPARLFRGMRVRATVTERRKACTPVFMARAI